MVEADLKLLHEQTMEMVMADDDSVAVAAFVGHG